MGRNDGDTRRGSWVLSPTVPVRCASLPVAPTSASPLLVLCLFPGAPCPPRPPSPYATSRRRAKLQRAVTTIIAAHRLRNLAASRSNTPRRSEAQMDEAGEREERKLASVRRWASAVAEEGGGVGHLGNWW